MPMTNTRTTHHRSANIAAYLAVSGMAAVATSPASAQSQSNANVSTVACNGTLAGSSAPLGYADVIVDGGSCILDAVLVHGSVKVSNGATVISRNGTQVRGAVEVKSGGDLTLHETTVSGAVTLEDGGNLMVEGASAISGVKLKNSGHITVGAGASAGSLVVEGAGNVTVHGSVASLLKTGSGSVTFRSGARTYPGGVAVVMGSLTLCGAEIGIDGAESEGSGGLSVLMGGTVTADSAAPCGPSTIAGSVIVEKGEGAVRFIDATFAGGDLIVIERSGAITLDGVSLSDIKLEKNTGAIQLLSVATDSDSTIADNAGNVTIGHSTFGSDVEIKNNHDVSIFGSSFALEDVTVSNNDDVQIIANEGFNIMAIENEAVLLSANTLTDANVSKTSGSVSISGNTGAVLKCSDNNASLLSGSGNQFSELTDGQCVGF